MSLYARLLALAAIAIALAAGAWKCYTAGQANVRAEWTAGKLVASESARLREQAAQKSNERIDREYQIAKQRSAAVDAATDDSLRQLDAAAARADASAPSGADDPRPAIASECRSALAALDKHARSLAGQVAGLQGYASQVCMSQ